MLDVPTLEARDVRALLFLVGDFDWAVGLVTGSIGSLECLLLWPSLLEAEPSGLWDLERPTLAKRRC